MLQTDCVPSLNVILYFIDLMMSKLSISHGLIFIKLDFIKTIIPIIKKLSKAKLKLSYTSDIIYKTDPTFQLPANIYDIEHIQVISKDIYQKIKNDFI